MITLTGTVTGVSLLSFEPIGVIPLRTDAPSPRLHVKDVALDSRGFFTVDLVSPTEVAGAWDDGWSWRCIETATDWSRLVFVFQAQGQTMRYADIRPLGGGLR